jgi:hypothetical protein
VQPRERGNAAERFLFTGHTPREGPKGRVLGNLGEVPDSNSESTF